MFQGSDVKIGTEFFKVYITHVNNENYSDFID